MARRSHMRILVWALALLALLATGCAANRTQTSSAAPPPPEEKDQGPVPLYYDFGDVLVPSELKIDKNTSFVFKTPDLTAGVLSLKGRVEIASLITFFETNMAKDNWNPVSSFKSVRTIMLWQKENRWCVINIKEANLTTYVEIWVAPTTSQSSTGLLK